MNWTHSIYTTLHNNFFLGFYYYLPEIFNHLHNKIHVQEATPSFLFDLYSYHLAFLAFRRPTVPSCPCPASSTLLCISGQEHLQWIQAPQTGSVLWWRRVSPHWWMESMAALAKGRRKQCNNKNCKIAAWQAVRLCCPMTLTDHAPSCSWHEFSFSGSQCCILTMCTILHKIVSCLFRVLINLSPGRKEIFDAFSFDANTLQSDKHNLLFQNNINILKL